MSDPEFGGAGFAAGVVRGTRSFRVDKNGHLTGVSYKQVWKPGENVAQCLRSDDYYMWAGRQMFGWWWSVDDDFVGYEPKVRALDPFDTCSHGFYGYYDGSNDYYKPGRVMGVIEGYGETLIGTRGFRCMKARIVAIRIPKYVSDEKRALVLQKYPDVPVFDKFKRMVAEFPPDSGMEEA